MEPKPIHWIFIYATQKAYYSPDLMMQARGAAMKAHRLVCSQHGIIVLDRYGIESEVMHTCQQYDIPLLVIGKTVRPTSAISMKHYERAILPKGTPAYMQGKLIRYASLKADEVVIVGDSPDCRAMRVYAGLVEKPAKHITTGMVQPNYAKYRSPTPDWLKEHGHHYIPA